jgi:DNA-binding beta-propeller fold protein YncE
VAAWSAPFKIVNCCDKHVLTVFPMQGDAIKIPLPFVPRTVVFSPTGTALYAVQRKTSAPGDTGESSVVKIEFNPTRLTNLVASIKLSISSFAVSTREDKIVVTGSYLEGGKIACGLFEIGLPGGTSRQILKSQRCGFREPWEGLSLSPTGEQAVASTGAQLQLIDLVHGTARSLPSQFSEGRWGSGASWSPDGKSIAVLESRRRGRTFLLDVNDLSTRRILTRGRGYHRMTPVWSPDSRYLLRGKLQLRCGIGIADDPPYTLEIVNVESGKRTMVRSSRCKMDNGLAGWLSSEAIH